MMMSASLRNQGENQLEGKDEIHTMFDAAMEHEWKEVVKAYKENPSACETILTKSEQTALHIAISSYPTDSRESAIDLDGIKEIVKAIPEEKAMEVLRLKDANGNTPLHLAATLGNVSLCEEIAFRRWQLIALRNNDNETPLFLAAHRGERGPFFLLRKIYMNGLEKESGPDDRKGQELEVEAEIESLCRGKDGNTVVHSAISGGYLRLAYRIIKNNPRLVHRVNVDGESPLHVLARNPKFFESSGDLSYEEYIMYKLFYVPKPKDDADQSAFPRKTSSSDKWYRKTTIGRFFGYCRFCGTDEENPRNNQKQPEGPLDPKKADEKRDGMKERAFRALNTCIRFIYPIVLLLFIFTIDYGKIKGIYGKKKKHMWAFEILKIVGIQLSSYKYTSNGQAPELYPHILEPRGSPPNDDDEVKVEHGSESSRATKMKQNQDVEERDDDDEVVEISRGNSEAVITNELLSITCKFAKMKEKEEDGTEVGRTPFLIAAKMGITEIMREILSHTQVAFGDVDEKGKNVLLLAIEHKQSKVLDFLLKEKVPDFVFEQVDKEGNGPHHLAAMYRPNSTWRLPGAALQMYGEVTWRKHVKNSLPQLRRPLLNKKGKTPDEIFRETHSKLAKDGTDWILKTAESSSVVAALIATVAFATSATVPGDFDDDGYPRHRNRPEFVLFTVSSLVALWFSLCSLVFFLAIITSRCELKDFRKTLPGWLLFGLSSLFISIAAILVSFCSAHFFLLNRNLKDAALPIYVVTAVPPFILAFSKLSLYIDLLQTWFARVPTRSNKMFYR